MRNQNLPVAVLVLLLVGQACTVLLLGQACTEKERAREFGGETTVNLPDCQKLVTATWKETNLWLLTRPMRDGEEPESYTFIEDSSWGMWEGAVYIKETCP